MVYSSVLNSSKHAVHAPFKSPADVYPCVRMRRLISFSFSSHLKSEVRSLLGFITGESPVDTDDCCLDLFRIRHKFNYVKCCEKSLYISTSPHAQYSRQPKLLLYVYGCDVMTQRHARISRGNPPVPLELKSLLQANRFESSYGKQIVLTTGRICFF